MMKKDFMKFHGRFKRTGMMAIGGNVGTYMHDIPHSILKLYNITHALQRSTQECGNFFEKRYWL